MPSAEGKEWLKKRLKGQPLNSTQPELYVLGSRGSESSLFYEALSQPIRLSHAYVVLLVPAQGIGKDEVARLDLPLEAKRLLDLEMEHPSLEKKGSMLGLLEPDRAEWHPLDSVFVSELRYIWKQAGEDVELRLTRKSGGTEITALR